jgi:hypothetical protein
MFDLTGFKGVLLTHFSFGTFMSNLPSKLASCMAG